MFILEDYDIRIARYLVAGVDIWLNNPRRPLEASGTSGMKAAANGVVNVSVLDGWWDEGWTGDNGWAIGGRETNPDEAAQDWADAQDLYRILEEEVVPRYYDRDADGVPRTLGRADAPLDGVDASGGSRRRGCSTSTSSGCTCRADEAAAGERRRQPSARSRGALALGQACDEDERRRAAAPSISARPAAMAASPEPGRPRPASGCSAGFGRRAPGRRADDLAATSPALTATIARSPRRPLRRRPSGPAAATRTLASPRRSAAMACRSAIARTDERARSVPVHAARIRRIRPPAVGIRPRRSIPISSP